MYLKQFDKMTKEHCHEEKIAKLKKRFGGFNIPVHTYFSGASLQPGSLIECVESELKPGMMIGKSVPIFQNNAPLTIGIPANAFMEQAVRQIIELEAGYRLGIVPPQLALQQALSIYNSASLRASEDVDLAEEVDLASSTRSERQTRVIDWLQINRVDTESLDEENQLRNMGRASQIRSPSTMSRGGFSDSDIYRTDFQQHLYDLERTRGSRYAFGNIQPLLTPGPGADSSIIFKPSSAYSDSDSNRVDEELGIRMASASLASQIQTQHPELETFGQALRQHGQELRQRIMAMGAERARDQMERMRAAIGESGAGGGEGSARGYGPSMSADDVLEDPEEIAP